MPAPARRAGGTGLGSARPCSLLEVGPAGLGIGRSTQASKAIWRKPQPTVHFPSFRSSDDYGALRRLPHEVPTPYLICRLHHCNDHFLHLSPSLSFIHSLTLSRFLLFQALGT